MRIFNRTLSVEIVNGCGIFLEIADSRAVWVYNVETDRVFAMPCEGVLLHLPFLLISYGRVYEEIEQ
jgi:hypothetical protein